MTMILLVARVPNFQISFKYLVRRVVTIHFLQFYRRQQQRMYVWMHLWNHETGKTSYYYDDTIHNTIYNTSFTIHK